MAGLVSSMIGILTMGVLRNTDPAAALRNVTLVATVIFLVLAYFATELAGCAKTVYIAVVAGCLGGITIGLLTEHYTSAGR
jgi:K(+)-stimulated pyrophosphate-energized sodium pump